MPKCKYSCGISWGDRAGQEDNLRTWVSSTRPERPWLISTTDSTPQGKQLKCSMQSSISGPVALWIMGLAKLWSVFNCRNVESHASPSLVWHSSLTTEEPLVGASSFVDLDCWSIDVIAHVQTYTIVKGLQQNNIVKHSQHPPTNCEGQWQNNGKASWTDEEVQAFISIWQYFDYQKKAMSGSSYSGSRNKSQSQNFMGYEKSEGMESSRLPLGVEDY